MAFNVNFGKQAKYSPLDWQQLHIDQFKNFTQSDTTCLRNFPKKIFGSPTCGNGIVEPGEECDCSLPTVCGNLCCNANTCKLRANAECATGKCCDLRTCQPKSSAFECRSRKSDCDLPEHCDGQSEFCPIDYFKRDDRTCNERACLTNQCVTTDKKIIANCTDSCDSDGTCSNIGYCDCKDGE